MAGSFTLPTVLANLAAGNQQLSLIDGDLTTLRDPLLSLNTFSNYYTDVGTANAYAVTVSSPQTVTQTAGLTITYLAANANTGAATFQVNALAVKNILNPDGSNLTPGQIPANALVTVVYDGTQYQLQTITGATKSLFAISHSGRLTLTTAVPVTSGDVSGATTVYFTPYNGNFTEVSQATTDATKSPAAVANNSNYDVFLWIDSGTIRATRGPAWTSDTARGTGAGTTELQFTNGYWNNKNAITNGPGAAAGIFLGTIRSDGSAQINDTLAKRHVWNNFNRRPRSMRVVETTASWNYTTATMRQANGSTSNQLDMVRGLDEDSVTATVMAHWVNTSQVVNVSSIGLDSTSASSTGTILMPTTNVNASPASTSARYSGFPGLGRHYLAWLEDSSATGTTTWYGNTSGGSLGIGQSGIHGEVSA